MNRILYALAGRLPCRIISDNGTPYLERYYLCTVLGVRFYLHRFVGSDPDRGLHDHPWPWAGSVVLNGWYQEERRGSDNRPATFGPGVVRRPVRWLNWLTGDTFHRVILPKRMVQVTKNGWVAMVQPCWTLFFHRAAYTKPWGFLRHLEGEKVLMWWPFNYPKDGQGTPGEWWNEVPQGRFEKRRSPL